MTWQKKAAARLRELELEREAIRVSRSEFLSFHETAECEWCGRDMDESGEGDLIECACGHSRWVPPDMRAVFEIETRDNGTRGAATVDRNLDGRTDWGPPDRYHNPFKGYNYTVWDELSTMDSLERIRLALANGDL